MASRRRRKMMKKLAWEKGQTKANTEPQFKALNRIMAGNLEIVKETTDLDEEFYHLGEIEETALFMDEHLSSIFIDEDELESELESNVVPVEALEPLPAVTTVEPFDGIMAGLDEALAHASGEIELDTVEVEIDEEKPKRKVTRRRTPARRTAKRKVTKDVQ